MNGQCSCRQRFAAPSDFGRHRVWSYVRPGIDGRGNPSGRRKPFATADEIFAGLLLSGTRSNQVVVDRPLDAHLLMLGEAAQDRRPALRSALAAWRQDLEAADLPLSQATLTLIASLCAFVSLTADISATWRLLMR